MNPQERLDLYCQAMEGKYGMQYSLIMNHDEVHKMSAFIDMAKGNLPLTPEDKQGLGLDLDVWYNTKETYWLIKMSAQIDKFLFQMNQLLKLHGMR